MLDYFNRQSTIPGLTIGQAIGEALKKQLLHEMELREKAKGVAELAKISEPTPQTRLGGSLVKQKAGQSQILERLKLIEGIRRETAELKKPKDSRSIQKSAENIRQFQQRLVNLLARYRF